jgi:hypothetical protein
MSTATVGLQWRSGERRSPSGSVGFAGALKTLSPFFALSFVLLLLKPGLLRVAFPATACFFGYHLYKRNESYYLSFTLWICMLSPLLRRLVDYRTSYQLQSLILLAPLLLTLLPAIHLRHRLARIAPVIRTGTFLALGGVIFGAGVGMIKHPGTEVIASTLMWLGPIMLCVFAASIEDRETLRRVLRSTFICGVLLMSAYGIYQFVVAPPWDTYWLHEVNIGSLSPSFGHPQPYGIRVWSTMNSPGSFALFLSAALIWLATLDGFFPAMANMMGYLALSLTLVRTAWMMTIIGIVIYVVGSRKRISTRSIAGGVLTIGLVAGGLLYVSQFPGVTDRLNSFSSLKSDRSVEERKAMYRYMTGYILSNPFGDGLQSSPGDIHGYLIDSTFIELFALQGWIGGLCYGAGLVYLLGNMARGLRGYSPEKVGAIAVTLACATQAASGDILYRQGGVVLWLFIGVWANFAFAKPHRSLTSGQAIGDRPIYPEKTGDLLEHALT